MATGDNDRATMLQKLETVVRLYDNDDADPAMKYMAFDQAATAYRQMNLPERAIPLYGKILAILEAAESEPSKRRAVVLYHLATVQATVGRQDAAIEALVETVRILQTYHPDERATLYSAMQALASTHLAAERYAEAEAIYLDILSFSDTIFAARRESIAATHHNLGGLYMKMGDLQKSEASFKLALSIKTEIFGESHPQIGLTLYNLSGVYERRGEDETARKTMARAIDLLGRDPLADHPARRR